MKSLTAVEFGKYLERNGMTQVRLTRRFKGIPGGTRLWFAVSDEWNNIATYDCETESRNKQFGYSFDYEWGGHWKNYGGKFIIGKKKRVKLWKVALVGILLYKFSKRMDK